MSKKQHAKQENATQNSSEKGDAIEERMIAQPFSVPKQAFSPFLMEWFLIFVVFFIFGAWPVPDENEPNYITKAIHFWNPEWLPNDTFLASHDTHWLFYQTFGWLSMFLAPTAMAWIGRVLLWGLLALGWQRLSWALLSISWYSVISAATFCYFMIYYQMAGEWVVGGVEGKVFAYVFVLFGLNALVRNRWNGMWVFFGLAAGFHVIVGGWSVVAGGVAWILQKRGERTTVIRMIPGLLIGGGLSLFGVIPGLMLDSGVPKEVAAQAHEIAVYYRLNHHLLPQTFPWPMIARMLILTLIWLYCSSLCWRRGTPGNRLVGFVAGTILISAAGFVIAYGFLTNRQLSADLLRLYWFRMTDFAIPMGIALSAVTIFSKSGRRFLKENWSTDTVSIGGIVGRWTVFVVIMSVLAFWLFSEVPPMISEAFPGSRDLTLSWGIILLIGVFLVYRFTRKPGDEVKRQKQIVTMLFFASLLLYAGTVPAVTHYARQRVVPVVPRTGVPSRFYAPWRQMCDWIAKEENTPKDAKFLIPRNSESFKWYANRSDVGVWKEMPQDSASMVKWYVTMEECFAKKEVPEEEKWAYGLASVLSEKSPQEIASLQEKYQFDYILAEGWPALPYPVVYQTSDDPTQRRYVLYQLTRSQGPSIPMVPLPMVPEPPMPYSLPPAIPY